MDNEMQKLKDGVEKYIKIHGKKKVSEAINQILDTCAAPRDNHPVVSDSELQLTVNHLDGGISDIIEVGSKKEELYSNKADLLKEIRQLETEIELAEAEAIMEIRGESSRSQYIMREGEKVAIGNDTAREALMKNKSAKYRKKLAEKEAELARIDQQLSEVNDEKSTVKESNESIRAKARLQAALLNYLANGGN